MDQDGQLFVTYEVYVYSSHVMFLESLLLKVLTAA